MSDYDINDYKQASPSGGVFFYKKTNDGGIEVYLSERLNTKTGQPTGTVSLYGGFAECADILQNPIGYVQDKRIEIYRELYEEAGLGIQKVLSEAEFVDKAEFIASLMVVMPTLTENVIHDALFMGYEVKKASLHHFFQHELEETDEQLPAKPYKVKLSHIPEEPLQAPYEGHELLPYLEFEGDAPQFHYEHEKKALCLLLRQLQCQ